ncbi:hypothetical protein Fmac_027393 [Flemingia macrophylla]|uniref:Uncharacterized protein n=1 Tax=Flemingia macrophylla TaxID=520843 RepID=A0ABD1LHK7_9FABA
MGAGRRKENEEEEKRKKEGRVNESGKSLEEKHDLIINPPNTTVYLANKINTKRAHITIFHHTEPLQFLHL